MSLKLCSTHVARELASGKVRAECAKQRSVEGQLKAFSDLAPFAEHCCKQDN